MIDFLAWMFATPDAQLDAYSWGAALLGHFAIGVFLTAAVGWLAGAWRGAAIVIVAYALGWEGGQILVAGSALLDSFVDALAVGCGAVVAAGAWSQRGAAVGVAMAILAIVGTAGIKERR